MAFTHRSVLLKESVDALAIRPTGIYLDATAGGGGHSRAILDRLTTGRLVCIDQDPDAVSVLRQRLGADARVTVVQDNFVNFPVILDSLGLASVDGVLADLGVSSHQLDTPERGFSFHQDAPLDMRMSRSGETAADLVNTLPERELTHILRAYGEERYAAGIAHAIVRARAAQPIETTVQLAELIKSAVPAAARREGGHPARRTFQALRIAVNGELDKLSEALGAMFSAISPTGRLAVITFHSLEDRIVKRQFSAWCEGCTCPRDFPVCVCGKTPRGRLPVSAQAPASAEVEENPRSRSARLRVIEKI